MVGLSGPVQCKCPRAGGDWGHRGGGGVPWLLVLILILGTVPFVWVVRPGGSGLSRSLNYCRATHRGEEEPRESLPAAVTLNFKGQPGVPFSLSDSPHCCPPFSFLSIMTI